MKKMNIVIVLLLISLLLFTSGGCARFGCAPVGDNIDGKDNGDNGQIIDKDNGDSGTEEPSIKKQDIKLYFAGENAEKVVAEIRTVEFPENISKEDFIKLVLEELIKGPESPNLYKTIPPEAKINTVEIKDDIVYIDFSEEMITKHWHGAAGEAMTLSSIVNTLTEFDYIKKVMMTVEGETMLIEHIMLEEPLERNEEMIGDK